MKPIHFDAVIADGAELARKELKPGAQLVGQLLIEVEADFGELEAALFGVGQVIVSGGYQKSLADEPVDLDGEQGVGRAELEGERVGAEEQQQDRRRRGAG